MVRMRAGMHNVVLSFGDDEQLQQSTAFLSRAHPLNYTAAVKKSQVCVGDGCAARHLSA